MDLKLFDLWVKRLCLFSDKNVAVIREFIELYGRVAGCEMITPSVIQITLISGDEIRIAENHDKTLISGYRNGRGGFNVLDIEQIKKIIRPVMADDLRAKLTQWIYAVDINKLEKFLSEEFFFTRENKIRILDFARCIEIDGHSKIHPDILEISIPGTYVRIIQISTHHELNNGTLISGYGTGGGIRICSLNEILRLFKKPDNPGLEKFRSWV